MKHIILLGIITATILPFFHAGLFDVHDPTSAFRLYTLVETIKAGQFPPAWNNSLNFGFGYPLHLYYAPLFSYLSALFVPLLTYEISIKVALFIASIVGSYGVYKLMIKVGFYPAILASTAFTLLPYRASGLYVRGSYAEFLAMSLMPWVIYFWVQPQNNKKTIFKTGIITALFVLSHNTLPIIFLPAILVMIALFQTKFIKGALGSLIIVAGLTSWFIFPVLFERDFVQVENIAKLTGYKDHFVSLSQLWYSRWGYGGSTAGVAGDNMSFMLGKGQVILSVLGLVYLYLHKKWKELILLSFITIMAIFLSLNISSFIWDMFPILSVMQFPWRSLAVSGIGLSLLGGYSLLLLPKKYLSIMTIIACVLLLATNIRYFSPQEYRNYNYDILSSQNNLDPLVKNKIPEYLPKWMPVFPSERIGNSLTRDAISVTGEVRMEYTEPLTIDTAYMPHWRLILDGRELDELIPTPIGTISTTIDVAKGVHQIELIWHRTSIEKLGIGLTLVTIAAMIGLWIL